MSLLIINGSPRNKKSNSKILADKFLEGFASVSQEPFEVFYLASASSRQALMTAFESVDTVIIIFPLYTDSMPAIVKTFFEELFHNRSTRSKTMGFIVQSGFTESVHSTFVAAWLENYHQPTDDVEKIIFSKVELVARLVYYTACELATRKNRLSVNY